MAPNRVERFLKKITLRRWEKIYKKKYTNADFQIAFKTTDYASKNHPNHYQKKVATLYSSKVNTFRIKLEPIWDPTCPWQQFLPLRFSVKVILRFRSSIQSSKTAPKRS